MDGGGINDVGAGSHIVRSHHLGRHTPNGGNLLAQFHAVGGTEVIRNVIVLGGDDGTAHHTY